MSESKNLSEISVDQLYHELDSIKDSYTLETIREKEKQLRTIEQAIQKMRDINIQIPAEMLEVKLRLVKEIDEGKEKSVLKDKYTRSFLSIIQEFGDYESWNYSIPGIADLVCLASNGLNKLGYKKLQPTSSNNKDRNYDDEVRVTIADLCKAGLLAEGDTLYHNGTNGKYHAKIKNGKVVVEKNGEIFECSGPSTAAEKMAGKVYNGWRFWFSKQNGKAVRLDNIRKAYKTT